MSKAAVIVAIGIAGLVGCGSHSSSAGTGALSPEATQGRQLASQFHCTDCHSPNGAKRQGPTWKGIWGSTVQLDDGTSAVVDTGYVAESIRQPQEQVVKGFAPIMPTLALTDPQIAAVTAYIRALGTG
ncbi:MAG TPA: c-type cytochrome [Acidimicrobiales bacterium]